MQTLKPMIAFPARVLVASAIVFVFQTVHAEPSSKATVYHEAGKKRVHVDGCRRLTQDPDERAKLTKMTLDEAKAKGLELCSRCPGNSTPGKDKPEAPDSGLESRVNPAYPNGPDSRERIQAALARVAAMKPDPNATLDLMLPQSFAAEHGGGEVFKVEAAGLATHAGVRATTQTHYHASLQSKN